MLPTKVFQIDYQDIAQIVSVHIDYLMEYERNNELKLDLVLAKLRNGTIPGSMIANHLQIPMGVVEIPREAKSKECKIFFPNEIEDKLKNKEKVNILFVDGICGTGKTLEKIKQYIANHKQKSLINLITYCTFTDTNAKTKPDIMGLEVIDRFIQPPWEWRSYTPQVHLDRLEAGDIKASEEKEFCIGFVNNEIKQLVEDNYKKTELDWTMVFSEYNSKTNTASGISTFHEIPEKISIYEGMTKYKNLLQDKVSFINQNGLTHYIESDINQALLLSQYCPVCHIIYIENSKLFRIFSKEVKEQDLDFNY